MYYFCTYFDHHFLERGLSLYKSLKKHCLSFQLWVLSMDHSGYEVLSQLKLPNLRLIALEDFEKGDEELLRAKKNRTRVEYYFTSTPSLLLYILNNHPEVDIITYLDADLFFFADPKPVYDEIDDHSIVIIEHRFPSQLRWREKFGIYNVGWLSFRHNQEALDCLRWWRRQCIEWCYDRTENGRYADQKYLDDWPTRFKKVKVLQHKGADLAPWNLANYNIYKRENRIWVEQYPLIFFHFHDLSSINNWLYDPHLAKQYQVKPSVIVRRNIYGPYLQTLLEVARLTSALMPERGPLSNIDHGKGSSPLPQTFPLSYRIKVGTKRLFRILIGVFRGEYIFVIRGYVV